MMTPSARPGCDVVTDRPVCDACRTSLRLYGIDRVEANELIKKQGGCAICQKSTSFGGNSSMQRAAVDHCHVTGKVRGILCTGCNTAIGKLGDSVEGVMRAVRYLEKIQ